MSLKLEVGKSYHKRSGPRVTITSKIEENTQAYALGYRFVGGGCGQYYTEDGKVYPNDPDLDENDLVSEAGSNDVSLSFEMRKFLESGKLTISGTNAPKTYISSLTEDMVRSALSGEAGYEISRHDVDQNCSVLAKHAIAVALAAFEVGRKSGQEERKD